MSGSMSGKGSRVTLARALASEAVRMRRSPLLPLHAALAGVLGCACGAYFGTTPWDAYLSCDAFFQLLGAGAPLLAGLSCGLAADAEREAGACANLLGTPSRRCAFAAKGIVLLALGTLAAALAAALFCALMAACARPLPSAVALVQAVGGLALGSASLYAVELGIALRFGRNAAIGVGALGFAAALACVGGLANGLVTGTFSGLMPSGWMLAVPFAWPSRLASLNIEWAVADVAAVAGGAAQAQALLAALRAATCTCAAATAAVLAACWALANRFEDACRASE